MHPAHPHDEIAVRALQFYESAGGLDLLGGEDRHALPHHVGRNRDRGPAHKVGETLGHTVEGASIGNHREPTFPHRLSGPGYADVGAKQSLVRRESRESGVD